MYFLKIKITNNNIFLSITNEIGKEFIGISAGSSGFSGPARATDYAAEQAGRNLGFLIRKKKIKEIILILTSRIERKIKAALKGLFSFKIRLKKIIVVPKIAHNGVRLRKRRRK